MKGTKPLSDGKPCKDRFYDDDDKSQRGCGTRKAFVIGVIKRGGGVFARAIQKDNVKGRNLRVFVRDNVDTQNIFETTLSRGLKI